MIKIAICDDSEYMRKQTDDLLLKYSLEKNLDYSVKQFDNGEALLEEIDSFNLIFLDYQFEGKGADGMTIAKEIRKKNSDVTIIFLSSYTNVVFEAFEVSAFRFLIKPLSEESLYTTMDDYMKSIQSDKTILIKVDGTNHIIYESQITYIEANGKKAIIHLANDSEPIEVNETLSDVEEKITENCFNRCHKSFVVNMKYIDSFCHTDIILTNKESVMVSRQKYKSFCDAYAEYISNN
ncbi:MULTISPECIES: LytR/AlgR family response regulator transcription factor [Pseudobutyrivibrio]|uniref:Stage 0 sporulation protein A homolog n=1 Tax=Pseudobutyrivibrio xylanivorans TaxID=185007 RepID=A0A1G5RYJ8_PSEXY|nr:MULTISPECIES: LytTR family DNA-binding domain-containing protein [Pseudobutyrivibrio]MDC7279313.1 LytTR family DNA-binding domain-containing protein [Butyrivibrio fibrisolvens]SCZ78918.1 two component transcriptional regulator, LytTR family [Pseudobutyrivibrio xylanivorans]